MIHHKSEERSFKDKQFYRHWLPHVPNRRSSNDLVCHVRLVFQQDTWPSCTLETVKCQHSMRLIVISVGQEVSVPDTSMAEVERNIWGPGVCVCVCVWESWIYGVVRGLDAHRTYYCRMGASVGAMQRYSYEPVLRFAGQSVVRTASP